MPRVGTDLRLGDGNWAVLPDSLNAAILDATEAFMAEATDADICDRGLLDTLLDDAFDPDAAAAYVRASLRHDRGSS